MNNHYSVNNRAHSILKLLGYHLQLCEYINERLEKFASLIVKAVENSSLIVTAEARLCVVSQLIMDISTELSCRWIAIFSHVL